MFGWGQDGCLGHGSEESKTKPLLVELPTPAISVACGGMHAVAVVQPPAETT